MDAMTTTSQPPRFSYFDLPGGSSLAVHSTTKLKTVSVIVTVAGNLDETVTKKALLPMILRRGTRSLPGMQAINRFLESLYGTLLSTSVQKVGEWQLIRFRLDVVNERFIPGAGGGKVLRTALEFLRDLLLDPLEVDGGFHPEYLEQEKANHRRLIESLVDNKAAYAEHRLIEEMCRNEPFRLHEQGRVDDIPGIDPRSLRELHKEWVRRSPSYIYITGDVEVDAVRDLLFSVFLEGEPPWEGGHALGPLPSPVAVGEPREVSERMDVNQARLVLGFRHGITYGDSSHEALLLMNGILGGFSHSKLFQNVREKASLAYSVSSSLERTKGLLFVSSGIDPSKHDQARDIMLGEVREMQAGAITDDEVQATVGTLVNHNEMLEDNLPLLCAVDLIWRLHGRPLDLAAFRARLAAARKDEIVEAARRLRLDTTYFLTAEAAGAGGDLS
jgi:predicted Zn-dependent peptidase